MPWMARWADLWMVWQGPWAVWKVAMESAIRPTCNAGTPPLTNLEENLYSAPEAMCERELWTTRIKQREMSARTTKEQIVAIQ